MLKLLLFTLVISLPLLAQESAKIKLPQPQTEGGRPLMETLKLRQSTRTYSLKPLSLQIISNLLWAAGGINRPESGKRTAPTSLNNQEIDIYLAMKDGLYYYNPKEHSLSVVLKEDIRGLTGKQDFVRDAPLNLVYVADFTRMDRSKEEDKKIYSAADAAFMAQNVYLWCASEGLGTVIRASIDKEPLAQKMKLKPENYVIFSQTVGYIKD